MSSSDDGQILTRLPAFRAEPGSQSRKEKQTPPQRIRPGMWVKLTQDPECECNGRRGQCVGTLCQAVRQVKSLTCSVTHPDQRQAQWRIHFDDGRCVPVRRILRPATDEEVRAAGVGSRRNDLWLEHSRAKGRLEELAR